MSPCSAGCPGSSVEQVRLELRDLPARIKGIQHQIPFYSRDMDTDKGQLVLKQVEPQLESLRSAPDSSLGC